MAGVAAAIGGLGQAAGEYGEQVRGLLEKRRSAMADLISRHADQEPDPQRRADLMHIAADLLGGKDVGKVIPKLMSTLQSQHESTTALNQAVAPLMGKPQAPKPGPAQPGSVPGTPQAPAAQPSLSPVSPQAQGGELDMARGLTASPAQTPQAPQIPSIEAAQAQPGQQATQPQQPITPIGMPQAQTTEAIHAKYSSLPEWSTPAGFARLKPLMDAEVQHSMALQQQQEFLQTGLSFKRAQVEHMKQSGMWNRLQPWQQMAYEAEAGGLTPVSMPGFAMTPRVLSPGAPGSSLPPDAREMGTGNPLDPKGFYRVEVVPMTGETIYTPVTPPTTMITNPDNTRSLIPRVSGSAGVSPSEAAPSIRGVTEQGNVGFTRPSGVGGTMAAPSLFPGVMITPRNFPTAGGGVEQISPLGVQRGATPRQVPGAVTPAMQPHTTVANRPGELPEITVRSVGSGTPAGGPISAGPAATTANDKLIEREYTDWVDGKIQPAGKKMAAVQNWAASHGLPTPYRLLTPFQQMTNEQKLGQYDTAVKAAKEVLNSATLLDSLLTSGKLQIAVRATESGNLLSALFSRVTSLTPAEQKVVQAMNALQESVNIIRLPLGASGFRGFEGWQALQAQHGNFLANPDITKGALNQLITEIENQSGPIRKYSGGGSSGVVQPIAPPAQGGSPVDRLLQKYGVNK